ncbi:NADPH-dependent 2,4-dienoyl-CoA reductase, sulfur reductase [Desulfotomaculum arcticum]|uniref:NADPH-dependent 2,4-dienoyl-CoA reductase, sulfur reductase n=1 Tax=Desulfotruncus arcticus DSM 17038 TaxID=1121424 RepID=A0A1I2MQ40_9FIRM|nr:FAD-dependent oxidoreductase [Desulfotruncus arcticus]SFF93238.1 NADPH-dependent 2,4-dienoyl-CoA reductase, sulfur reductase [Desulfotomaculum arcticum] [Desulfotruncus arcticus DSM 17038]
MGKKIVIIGGVAAGPKAAARARRLDPEAEITIIEKGKLISYAGCGMPYYLSGEVHKYDLLFETTYGVIRDEDYFWREKGCRVLTRTEAKSIDRDKKEVLVENLETGEKQALPYDKLVLATGAEPFVPPIEGLNLKGVHKLNHPEDAQKIKEMLGAGEGGEAAIIGAGLIGLETADALMKLHMFCSVIELQDQILPGMMDPDMAELLAKKLTDQGIEFYLGHKVLKLEGDEDGNVTTVVTDQGPVDAELVVVAVGVRPNVKLARDAGLVIGDTGAIAVNEYLQTSDPEIYALGDCAETTHLISGKKVFLPMATSANRQGRVVGDNLTGGNTVFKGVLGTAVMHAMGFNVGRTGLGEKQARDLGYKVVTGVFHGFDRTHYHPEHGMVMMKLITEEGTGRILGAQALGLGDAVKRIDVAATAITFNATADQLAEVDLGYAPPFSTPIDVAMHAANIVRNKVAGLAETISVRELKEKMERGDDMVILDVRTEGQFKMRHLKDDRVMLVVLGDLRERINEIPRDKEIVALCALGTRSYEALRILKGAGFKDVKYMEGGLQAWPYEF